MAEQIVVDPVAAAQQLLGVLDKNPGLTLRTAVEAAVSAAPAENCPLGHPNTAGAKFCAACGLHMQAMVLTERVNLEAERETVLAASQLSPEERTARDRQHVEALAAVAKAEAAIVPLEAQPDPSPQKILIHFVEDGLTWAGQAWQRGQEIEIGPEHPRWESALSWITLTKDQQAIRYGRVMFDTGPWPYRALPPGTEVPLPSASTERFRTSGLPARAGDDGALVPF